MKILTEGRVAGAGVSDSETKGHGEHSVSLPMNQNYISVNWLLTVEHGCLAHGQSDLCWRHA